MKAFPPSLAMPPRIQRPIFSFSYDAWRELCLLVLEQINDLMEFPTSYKDYLPRTPPPSPTRFDPSTCGNLDEAGLLTPCALHLVDRKIEAHQARLLTIQRSRCPPMSLRDVSGEKLERIDEQMHKMTPLRQVALASNDNDMTMTKSRCHSSRSSDSSTLVDEPLSSGDIDQYSSSRYRRKLAIFPELETGPSSHFNSSPFGFSTTRSSRGAVAVTPCASCSRPQGKDGLGPCPTVTGKHASSPTPIGSSTIPNTAESPLEYEQSKAKSWPGPRSQLSGSDTMSVHRATLRSRPCECGFACACHGGSNSICKGGMSDCGCCASRSERRVLSKTGYSLRPSEELVRDVTNKDQGSTVEDPHSHFSDDSSDGEDESGKVPSNVRLFNSLGRLNQKTKTRLSWNNLFSKPG